MLRDWNFWCTVMTSVAAVVAIGVSVHQIRLSNKQQLFERRLKAYMMANSIISLCKENYVFLSEKRKAEPQFAIERCAGLPLIVRMMYVIPLFVLTVTA